MFLHSISARKPSPVLTLFQTLFSAPDTCDFTPFSWQRLGAGLLYSAHSQMKEWSLRLSDCPTLRSWQAAEAGFESKQAEPPTAMGTPFWERTPKEGEPWKLGVQRGSHFPTCQTHLEESDF